MNFYVSEIFKSIQGESSFAGLPCVFLRLAGCNLRCRYCDTPYAQVGGDPISLDQIMCRVASYDCPLVEITGGEPLAQADTPLLALALLEKGFRVLVETNGSLDISILPPAVVRIMDIKCPSSGESHSILWRNVLELGSDDEVKFVISDRADYEWARGKVHDQLAGSSAGILFSTTFGKLHPRNLVEWMLKDSINARFQLQLHKYIWPPETRGV